jgi:hypothetical protein
VGLCVCCVTNPVSCCQGTVRGRASQAPSSHREVSHGGPSLAPRGLLLCIQSLHLLPLALLLVRSHMLTCLSRPVQLLC